MSPFPPLSDDIFQAGGQLRRELWTANAWVALEQAAHFASRTHWESVRTPHIFMGLLATQDAPVQRWSEQLGMRLADLLEQFQAFFRQPEHLAEVRPVLHREFFSDNALRLLRQARERATAAGRPAATSMDLLICLLTSSPSVVVDCFEHFGGIPGSRLTELAIRAEREVPGR